MTDQTQDRGPRAAAPPWGPKPARGPIPEVISGYRFYNPDLGRWNNRDPIGRGGGVNIYVFVHNNGIISWDYLGKLSDDLRDCYRCCYAKFPIMVGVDPTTSRNCTGSDLSECVENCNDQSQSIGSLSISPGFYYTAEGCIYIGSNGKICISGTISSEKGTCCDESGNKVNYLKGEGSIGITAALVTNPSFDPWDFKASAAADVGHIGSCPAKREFEISSSISIFASLSAGQLTCSYDVGSGD